MFTAIETLPQEELKIRQDRCRAILHKRHPEAGGMLIFSRADLYHLTGAYAMGVLWLPLQGRPVLLVRKGQERAELESPGFVVGTYKSFSSLPAALNELGSPLTKSVAVEQGGLTWTLGLNLARALKDCNLIPADDVLMRSRSAKTALEVQRIRRAGAIHHEVMDVLFPAWLKNNVGETEYLIGRELWHIFFGFEHCGATRMAGHGEELYMGGVSVGLNGIYPTYYNGPTGGKGIHPSCPHMGSVSDRWTPDSFVVVDSGSVWQGYNTDKTRLYFAGSRAKVPAAARKAQDCALEIQAEVSARLKPGAIPEEIYQLGLAIAAKRGFAEGFMGLGGSKVPFLGHAIGLNVDEWPVIANKFTEPLEENVVFAVEPKIAIAGYGLMGVENTFLVTPKGGEPLTTRTSNLADDNGDFLCLEDM